MSEQKVSGPAWVAFALFVVIGALLSEQPPAVIAACAVSALLAAALTPRSGWRLLGGALVAGGAVTALCFGSSSNIGWFALCVLAGRCALLGGTVAGVVFTASATVVLAVQAAVFRDDPGWFAWVAGTVFTLVVCLMSRRQYELLEQLRGAQAGLADRVRAEERHRVARELHDVIAHSLTVSLLHVTSARLAVEDDPAEAAQALAQAEELGRRSLDEVRHAVGLLRDDAGSRTPMPGAEQLPALVDGFRQAGAQVAYDVVGDPARLPATTGLTVYRILQESLTNVVRHGDGTPAAVRIEVGDRAIVLTVDNDSGSELSRGDGVGLLSMQERAQAIGGELSAGPTDTGWRVHAVLPS